MDEPRDTVVHKRGFVLASFQLLAGRSRYELSKTPSFSDRFFVRIVLVKTVQSQREYIISRVIAIVGYVALYILNPVDPFIFLHTQSLCYTDSSNNQILIKSSLEKKPKQKGSYDLSAVSTSYALRQSTASYSSTYPYSNPNLQISQYKVENNVLDDHIGEAAWPHHYKRPWLGRPSG